MPLPGGSAGKVGVHYEDKWTAHCAFEVLRERASAIRIEPPGPDGDGIEFWLHRLGCVEYHQVKRQKSQGEWTVAALRDAGVLVTFEARLRDPSARCVFVSTQSASVFRDLTEYARKAASYAEFEADYLKADARRKEYALLRTLWRTADDQAVMAMLRRVEVTTVDEKTLESWIGAEAESILDGAPAALSLQLIRVLQGALNEIVYADDLWKRLAELDVRPAPWRGSPHLATQIAEANQRYLSSRRSTLIGGRVIARPEADILAATVKERRKVLVCGDAGAGKSDVLLQLVEALEREGTPHLAFRLDGLSPVEHPALLAKPLGLPASPVAALAALARDRQSVLIIDQLDIVSTTSGRHPEFFDCVAEVFRQASAIPTLTLVVACRTFDVENDGRLRQLVGLRDAAARMVVGSLGIESVRSALDAAGMSSFQPSPAQLELLRLPIHLALLCESAGISGEPEERLEFVSSNDLFERFWKHKRLEVTRRKPDVDWIAIIDALVEHMNASQALIAPAEIVDRWEMGVEVMISSHVLRRDGRCLAFAHEAFFDYAFARRSVERGRTIRELLNADQLLFRRAQVRQMLELARASAIDRFRVDLAFLLGDSSVRFHLKDMVMAWLAHVQPDAATLSVVAPLLADPSSPLFTRAWRLLGAEPWFSAADEAGHVRRALETGDVLAERACGALASATTHSPAKVAALLRPYLDRDGWSRRVAFVLAQPDAKLDGDLFLLGKEFVVADVGAHGREGSASHVLAALVRRLAEGRPEWGAVLFGAYLRASWERAQARGHLDLFDRREGTVDGELYLHEQLLVLARDAHEAFIEHVVSVVFEVANAMQRQYYEDELWIDSIWSGRYLLASYGTHGDLAESLLQGAAEAMRVCARRSPGSFRTLLNRHGGGASETIAYLFAQGFEANAPDLADDALDFLLADPRRLSIGYSDDRYWEAHKLLRAVTPFATEERLCQLEARLLRFQPACDRRPPYFGRTQFRLLAGIDESRRSSGAGRRLQELRRKFGDAGLAPPRGVVGGLVESPVARKATLKMNDSQWRRAIAKYSRSHDEARARPHEDFLKGDAHELASELEAVTKAAPSRFAALVLSLPDETNTAYFDAVLRGVAAAAASITIEQTTALVERCHRLPDRPCGRWIGGPIQRIASQALPEALYVVLEWYAVHDPDPSDELPAGVGLLHCGLNSVRGHIAGCVAALIAARAEHFVRLRSTVTNLVSDRSRAVRAMAAEVVLALASTHSDEAERLFSLLLEWEDDELLDTHFVQFYIWHHARSNLSLYRSVIRRLLASPVAGNRAAGARNAVALGLDEPGEDEPARACRSSDDSVVRAAAARVYAANLVTARFREACEAALAEFFDDSDTEVRKVAGNAIWRLTGSEVGEHVQLCERFLRSAAFPDHPDHIVHALKESTARVPALVLRASEAVFARWEGEKRSARLTYTCKDAFALVLRAYTDALARPEKERALDLLDRGLRGDIYGVAKDLESHDRGWL